MRFGSGQNFKYIDCLSRIQLLAYILSFVEADDLGSVLLVSRFLTNQHLLCVNLSFFKVVAFTSLQP